jgi:hypothetical protein
MWIGDVDIPEGLIEAARAGSLVVFVGAGASRDAPADLPDFRELTRSIASEAAWTFNEAELDQPDLLLGRIDDGDVDVHLRVRAHIDRPESGPNALHEAIVALVSAMPVPRIVTTNYDNHLTQVAQARGLALAEYMAPALPMGDDFEGLVYLHGSLRQDARHLIVTDADFGRAYLRDAWAARFLERMFSSFTVLFVGYSHRDIVMRYLARSLGTRSTRYALTSEPGASDWRQLSILPIAYEVRDSSHAALTEGLAKWARRMSMGLLDHQQQIARLTASPPSSIPEEESYLRSVLGDEHLVGLFGQLAPGEAWMSWASRQPESRTLFDPKAPPTEISSALAFWFADRCLSEESLSNAGLRLVSEAGGRLSAALWSALGQRLHAGPSQRAAWLRPWIPVLIENALPNGQDWLEFALAKSTLPEDRDAALLLFDYLTEPHLVPKPSFGLGAAPRFDVEIRGDDYWLREAWTKLLQPNLASIVDDVLASTETHLRKAHSLLAAAGQANPRWDPVSFGRSSIAAHPQDRYGDKIGILIDAARDAIEHVAAADVSAAAARYDIWSTSDVPILRRLALHGLAVDGHRSGTDKLTTFLAHGWLFDLPLRHEAFELLEAALPSADDAVVDALVDAAVLGPRDVEEEDLRSYEIFNALAWISRYAKTPRAQEAFARAQAEHPTFGVREHPDFNSWLETGFRATTPGMPVDEFHALLGEDRNAALGKLAEFKEGRTTLDSPTWSDATTVVEQTVGQFPEDGFLLLGDAAGIDEDLIGAVVNGWATGRLEDELAQRVIDRVSTFNLDRWGRQLAELISRDGGTERTQWPRLDSARELARAIARNLADEAPPTEVSNWLDVAVNAPAGRLAEFWLRAIGFDWNSNKEGWTGLSPVLREAMDELLDRGGLHGAVAEVILASQLHFLFAADREWCQANALPLLAWSDPARARRTWDGFLYWGRWTDQLLESGLLADYLDAAPHIDGFEDEVRRQYGEHLAAVALLSEVDPGTWIGQFTRAASEQVRVEWLNHVTWALDRVDADVVERQWNRWMRAYWAQRLDSVPLLLAFDEASAMAAWIVKLVDATDDAVGLAVGAPAGLQQHGGLLRELKDHIERGPAAYARLLGHLLTGTNRPFWECDVVGAFMSSLNGRADEHDVRRIREQGLRLGCNGAAAW